MWFEENRRRNGRYAKGELRLYTEFWRRVYGPQPARQLNLFKDARADRLLVPF
jgi:hypothetical protein